MRVIDFNPLKELKSPHLNKGVGYQLINVGGMPVLENHHFATIITIRQKSSVDAKISGWEFDKDLVHLQGLKKYLSINYFLMRKDKTVHCDIINMHKIYYFIHHKLNSPRLSLLLFMRFDDLQTTSKNKKAVWWQDIYDILWNWPYNCDFAHFSLD